MQVRFGEKENAMQENATPPQANFIKAIEIDLLWNLYINSAWAERGP